MPNIEHFKELRAFIALMPTAAPDMGEWYCKLGPEESAAHGCGSVGCIGGWTASYLDLPFNDIFGIGSYTYEYTTRDTYMIAMKATAYKNRFGEIVAMFKKPVYRQWAEILSQGNTGCISGCQWRILVPARQ